MTKPLFSLDALVAATHGSQEQTAREGAFDPPSDLEPCLNQKSAKRLLLVESDPAEVRRFREIFKTPRVSGIAVTHVVSLRQAERHLTEHSMDVVLLDLALPDAQGMEAIRRIREISPKVPLLTMTHLDDEALAEQALHGGAQDCLLKSQIDARTLRRIVAIAIERKLMSESLVMEKERVQLTLDCIADGVASTNAAGELTFLNVVAEQLTGWTWQEAATRNIEDVFPLLDATTRQPIVNPLGMSLEKKRAVHLASNAILVRRDGTEIFIEDSVASIQDRTGNVTGEVVVFRDVSAARAKAAQIIHTAEHDVLTGLPNRLLLCDRINQAISLSRRNDRSVAVLFLDLDNFKYINDSLGHRVGDHILQSVAQRLVGCLRGSDTVSRQGGDEFVALLSEMDHPEDAAITAKRMLQAVSEAHVIDNHELRITTSIGVSVYPSDGSDADTLIKNADAAMFHAKHKGRHSYHLFEPAMTVKALDRQSIEESLRHAVDREEFALVYQPKIELKTGKITGAEALLRWAHPTRGQLAPGQFIRVAESCGMILPIGRWVLREACKQARAWVDEGLPAVTMSVNTSAVELRSESFVKGVWAALDASNWKSSGLELDLTEAALMQYTDATKATLIDLRTNGVRLAVDNFGTSYFSLNGFQQLAIDTLKIDRSVVRQVTAGPKETRVVAAAIRMGRNLDLTVVAEGIETPAEAAFFQAHDCNEGQGHYFGRPGPPEALARVLRAELMKADVPAFGVETRDAQAE